MDQENNNSIVINQLRLAFGPVEVLKDINMEIKQGEFIVLLGASGSGKSTLLNCIAGLLDITEGQVFINDKNVTWAEPKDRGIGMVFQSYALYPQMSVKNNMAFGLKNAKMPKAEIENRITRAAEVLQIEPLLDRKPAALSGGQRQRVAIGRALVRDVDVFLFDEPLSNLDAKLRAELRVEIKQLHARLGNTMIYVTHDQIEALTLANRIALLKHGVIQQFASPHEIYHFPKNLFVAEFIGSPSMNFLEGKLTDGGATFETASARIPTTGYNGGALGDNPAAVFGIRPEHTVIHKAPIAGQTHAAIVEIQEHMGQESVIYTQLNGKRFSIRTNSDEDYPVGSTIQLQFDVGKASIFDAKTELRL